MADQPTRAHLQVHGVDVDVAHHVTVTFPPSLGGGTVKVPTRLKLDADRQIVVELNLDAVARRALTAERQPPRPTPRPARPEGQYTQPSMRKRAR